MTQRTRLGLPVLGEKTYNDYVEKTRGFGNYEEGMRFLNGLFADIKERDPLYAQFIQDTKVMYPLLDRDIAFADLIAGHELLIREGELPLLNSTKFRSRWDATMHRDFSQINVGNNIGIIDQDNPVFGRFIRNSAMYFPQEQRMNISSDLSSGYMFLVDNAERKTLSKAPNN